MRGRDSTADIESRLREERSPIRRNVPCVGLVGPGAQLETQEVASCVELDDAHAGFDVRRSVAGDATIWPVARAERQAVFAIEEPDDRGTMSRDQPRAGGGFDMAKVVVHPDVAADESGCRRRRRLGVAGRRAICRAPGHLPYVNQERAKRAQTPFIPSIVTREIGLRKALGARRREILTQFLVEAAALTLADGVLGVLAGSAIGVAVNLATGFPVSLPWWSFALGLGFSASMGIVFGMVPAVRASRLDPIEALRHE